MVTHVVTYVRSSLLPEGEKPFFLPIFLTIKNTAMKSSVRVLFWLYKSKKNSQGLIPIYMRITLDKDKTEIASGHFIQLAEWNDKKKRVAETTQRGVEINNSLEIQRAKITSIYNQLLSSGEPFTVETIKRKFVGKDEEQVTLLRVVEYHNNQVKSLIGKTYAQRTYDNYYYLANKLKGFLLHNYNRQDVALKMLNHQFLSEFEHYLKTVHNNKTNTVAKSMTNLKTILNLALDMDWMVKNPFRKYKNKKEEPMRTYLTKEEVKTVMESIMPNEHLQTIKDCIVFQIHTGVAYVDLKKLTTVNLITGIDGRPWIELKRQKTGTRSSLPILPAALKILDNYKDHPSRLNDGKLLPVTSNQKMNKQVKKIMEICNISKNISTHSFRRTFATTITLSNGIPIETVSKMLGHCDLKTTATYAKVVDTKISEDMSRLM
jgi:site-specific recombinase XerD